MFSGTTNLSTTIISIANAAASAVDTVVQVGSNFATGGTAVSLATSDSLTAGSMASRKLGLGVQSLIVGAPIGAMATPSIDSTFRSPLLVEPGTYCHIILKMPVADATANLVYRGLVIINGCFD